MVSRRSFSTGAIAAALIPVTAKAQQPKIWKIGFLAATTAQSQAQARLGAFLQGLRGLGYVEGNNIKVERRFADGDYKRLPGLAAELVHEKVDIIVASSTVSTQAAKGATTSIPIVAMGVGDPLGTGFAASLARPGGNVTGFSIISPDIIPKRIEMLLAALSKTKTFGVLANPDNPTYPIVLKSIQATAQKAGVNAVLFHASSSAEIERAFAAYRDGPDSRRAGVGRLVVHSAIEADNGTDREASARRHVRLSLLCGCGRPDELWPGRRRSLPPRGDLR